MKETGIGAKKYVEVGEVLEFAEVFFADPILRIATRSLLAAAPAARVEEQKRTLDRQRKTPVQKAIQLLEKEYERATKLEYVRKPLAYALYQVWRKVDSDGGSSGS